MSTLNKEVLSESRNFYQTLKNFDDMQEVEFPPALHGRIMRSLYLHQFKVPLVIINSILFVNLSISSWQLWKIIGPGIREIQLPALEGGLNKLAVINWQIIPVFPATFFAANLALMAIGVYLLFKLKNLLAMAKSSAK